MSACLRRAGRHLVALLLPQRCCLCGTLIGPDDTMCTDCRRDAPFILPPVCPHCGLSLHGRAESSCSCGGRHHAFVRCVAPLSYEGLTRRGIATLKHTGDACTVDGLAAEIGEVLRREYGGIGFTLVTAVPSYPRDLRRRGHDQAALLAAAVARHIGVPYVPTLRKLYPTRPQKELSAEERQGNLLGAFAVRERMFLPRTAVDRLMRRGQPVDLHGAVVLLIDDVMTTGATLDECAKMLRLYGAAEVYAAAAAATPPKKDTDKDRG